MKQIDFLTKPFVVTFIAIFCCALWGSATPFIKIGYRLMLPVSDTASTILFAGIRFFIAGAIVVMFYSIVQGKLLFPKRRNFGKITLISMFQTVIQYIFFYIGVANTTGVKATIISGAGTFSAILVACLFFRQERLTLKKLLACIIGFTGILLIHMDGLQWNINFLGDGFVFIATVAYGISSSLMKRYSRVEDPVVISGYQFMIGGIIMMLPGFLLGGKVVVASWQAVLVLGYLALLSAVAYSLWGILLKHNPISRVAVFSFMIPVFGVVLSRWLLSEQSRVSPMMLIISLLLICCGIFIQNDFKKRSINQE